MLDYLNNEIEKRKAEVAKIEAEQESLRQRRHDLGVELRVLEAARIEGLASQESDDRDKTPLGALNPTPAVTRTKLVAHWRVVLRAAVERFPEVVKTSEVPQIQEAAGYDPVAPNNVRTHFHKLRHEGLYEDGGWGAVRATESAAKLLGMRLGVKSDAKQNVGASNGQLRFGGSDNETAGHAHEANPAASLHH